MRWFISALITLAVVASPAAKAQRPTGLEPASEADLAVVRTCLTQHDDPDERQQCVRQLTRACIEAAGEGGETTGGLLVCMRREQMVWRAIMDESVAALRASESATQLVLLENALRQGEQWAIARCAYHASYYEGGSLARVLAAECYRDSAAEQALFFYARFNDRDE